MPSPRAIRSFGLIIFGLLILFAQHQAMALERFEINMHGTKRAYLLETPKSAATPFALVIVLHGGGGNAANAVKMTGFDKKARISGFVAAFPEGSTQFGNLRTWNAGPCCAYASEHDIDDLGFLDALIDDISARLLIDPQRVYVTGMSNGGMMAHRAGVHLSSRIAAIASVVGAVFGHEPLPLQPVSALMINGALDEVVPMSGGMGDDASRRQPIKTQPYAPSTDQLSFWAKVNGCSSMPQRVEGSLVIVRSYEDCKAGTAVRFFEIKDNGHAWPGGHKGNIFADAPSHALNATDVIWDFFKEHPKK